MNLEMSLQPPEPGPDSAAREGAPVTGSRLAEDGTRASRRLLAAVADTLAAEKKRAPVLWPVGESADRYVEPRVIRRWPDRSPSLETAVADFLPTAILLRRTVWDENIRLLEDLDFLDSPRFVSALSIIEDIQNFSWGQVRVIAAKLFLQPAASRAENRQRSELLARSGKGVPLTVGDGYRRYLLSGRLAAPELELARYLSPEEQLALVTILAARDDRALFLAENGDWPASELVWDVAARLGCRITRFTLDNIPAAVLQVLRHSRYLSGSGLG
ncbi:MAG: hypothetical protein ABIF77_00500 [bacterium]